MHRTIPIRLTALAAIAVLGACQPASTDRGPADDPADSAAPTPQSGAVAPSPAPSPPPSPPLTEEAAKGEAGARAILLDWARALENGDFAAAHALLASAGGQDMSEAEYAAFWSAYDRLTVAVPEGTAEGAAGSLYYEVLATITAERPDGAVERWQGPVVLRRANDVPGATAEQLHWHIHSADLAKQPG